MKRSEKMLLSLFALVFVIIVGGGLASYGFKSYRAVTSETDRLRTRLITMSQTVAQGSQWQQRAAWVDANIPKFASHEEASIKLIQTVEKEAQSAGLKITRKDPLPKRVEKEGDALGYFDQASVKLTFDNVGEKELFSWMHSLAELKAFVGITRMQLQPNPQGKTVNCDLDVTQFYRETIATKLSKAN